MIIAVDFDGTICEHEYPAIGDPVPQALETLLSWQLDGHRIILWTARSGEELDAAVGYLEGAGIRLFGVNGNPKQGSWSDSPKAYAQIYIDDAAFGCPLVLPADGRRRYVDWPRIRKMSEEHGLYGWEYFRMRGKRVEDETG